jgi:hypothetical protein
MSPHDLVRRERARGERLEEVALESSLGLGDGARLRELDREQRQRVTHDDAIGLGQRVGAADGEERLDATLSADGLHRDRLPAVDERQAEAGPVGSRVPELLPDALGTLVGFRDGRRERQAVQVEEQHPSLRDAGERRGDPVDTTPFHHRARQDVLGVDGALEHVVLLGEQAREHGLGQRDERDGVGHLEDGEAVGIRGGDDRLRDALVTEAEPESEAREPGVRQPLDVRALLRGRGADAGAGREEDLAALEPRSRVLELGAVDPPDGAVGCGLAGDEPEREAGDREDVGDGQGHRARWYDRTYKSAWSRSACGPVGWTPRTTRRRRLGRARVDGRAAFA